MILLGCVAGFNSKGEIIIKTKRLDTFEDLGMYKIINLASDDQNMNVYSYVINSIRSYTPMQIQINDSHIEINFPTEGFKFRGEAIE